MKSKSLIFAMVLSLLFCIVIRGGAESENDPAEAEKRFSAIIEEYRAAIHDPHYDSVFKDTFFSYEWRDYVDDPQSEPAYAIVSVNGQPVLLIGDRTDPAGMIRWVYRMTDGEVTCAAESTAADSWYLLTDGQTIRKEDLDCHESLMQFAWIRFWESRKAIVGGEKTGGLNARSGLDKESYSLGKEQTGLVVVVDEVVNGWAWYRYNATRKGYGAASWGYISDSGLIYPDTVTPAGTAVLAKNGKTSGKAMINVRFRATTKSRKILELPVGTVVDVYGSENGWTEIEWNRWHGFVKDEFVQ